MFGFSFFAFIIEKAVNFKKAEGNLDKGQESMVYSIRYFYIAILY